jgi:hypothetical protein
VDTIGGNGLAVYQFDCFGAGMLLLTAALFFSEVTLTSGDYQLVLRVAVTCCAVAMPLFVIPLIRGPLGWRLASVGLLVFDVLIVLSFANRLRA